MTLVVVDAGPLIALVQVGRLHLLRDLYGQVYATPIVAREAGPTVGAMPPWITIARPRPALARRYPPGRLDAGEYEALLLAIDLAADTVIVDDRDARLWAEAKGLRVLGTLGLLVRAKAEAMEPAIRPLVDELRRRDFFMTPDLYLQILDLAGEVDPPR